ncbi:ion channel [Pseudohoeflea coraliihabitans]|uniref:Potassium channel domain-containing protein n=1 Tax=Pseudohoeflea coraliihabitans TaxID=2860393 RepID=A0ABS6WMA8_9HYPH|nr:ion channel [Pseudohoeflea sp. DP4N28-3]MBW3097101.1 hypothetical protein [Pseudohoeflea sp. DP4N28-3]
MTWVLLFIAVAAVAILGVIHHSGILLLRKSTPLARNAPHIAVLFAFQGLLLLHLVEIGLFAGLYGLLLNFSAAGGFSGEWTGSLVDHIVFSGVTFATLGMTDIKVEGPLRLVVFAQALGGFMVITWSATFLYSLWSRPWD